jgi:hypothetical protein
MEAQISFVRNFKNSNGWEQAKITEEESNNIQGQLREINNRIFVECLKDAHEALKQFIIPYSNPLAQIQQAAERLFEKRAIHSLTAYQEFLTAKIEKLRNGSALKPDDGL